MRDYIGVIIYKILLILKAVLMREVLIINLILDDENEIEWSKSYSGKKSQNSMFVSR